MNRNSIIALVIGVLFGVLAFYLLYQQASDIERRATPVQVLLASEYIPAGTYLRPDMVEKKSIPESYISPSAVHDVKEVAGLVTMVPISSGEQILANKFGIGEETLSLALNPGYRAYTLAVNETSGVGNLLRPGNYVDILTRVDSDKRSMISFAFQNIQVIAVGQRLTGKLSSQNGSSGSDSGGYNTVTLALTPQQAETLMYLEGRPLRLVLRGPNDAEIVDIPPQSESEVLAKLGHFSAAPRHGIQIIHTGE